MKRFVERVSRFLHAIRPPGEWLLPVLVLTGAMVGLAVFVFHVSRASSYLSDDPTTCVNCHVMAPQYATWFHGRHRDAATCSDCHVPHDNILKHYAFKMSDGMRHAYMFTFRLEPQVIRIHAAGQRVVQQNCIRCHEASISDTKLHEVAGDAAPHDGMRCWACHRETPHGTVRGLAAVPYEQIPLPGPVAPSWLMERMRGGPAPVERGTNR